MSLPSHVRLVEVGPRDGLQNEAQPISVSDKVRRSHAAESLCQLEKLYSYAGQL